MDLAMLNELKIEKRMTIRSQISNYLREAIMCGKLSNGSKLLPIRKLASQWGTQPANIHAALSPLVKEGLLIRKHGVATIVNVPESELQTIAIYESHNSMKPMKQFTQLLLANIQMELTERNIDARIIIETPDNNGFSILQELAESRRIQGVIIVNFDRLLMPKLQKLPVPFSCITSRRIKNRVQTNDKDFIDKIIEAVLSNKGKRLGIISVLTQTEKPVNSGEKDNNNFYKNLFSALDNAGIETRPEWNAIAGRNNPLLLNFEYDKFAFESFKQVWGADGKPDCIFVYTDKLITGTLLSVISNNIKIPEELKLIFHNHFENKIFCPLPCCYIEDNIRDMAKGLIDLIDNQFHGKEISQIEVKYELVNHQP